MLVAAIAVAASLVTPADSGMRCGKKLVSLGQRPAEVQARCGLPLTSAQRTEHRASTIVTTSAVDPHKVQIETIDVEVIIDEWVYDLGDNRFVRFLRFENGRLTDIAAGARGTRATEDTAAGG